MFLHERETQKDTIIVSWKTLYLACFFFFTEKTNSNGLASQFLLHAADFMEIMLDSNDETYETMGFLLIEN